MAIVDKQIQFLVTRDPTDGNKIFEAIIDVYQWDNTKPDTPDNCAFGTRIVAISPTVASISQADFDTHVDIAKAQVIEGKTLLVQIADRITDSQAAAAGNYCENVNRDDLTP